MTESINQSVICGECGYALEELVNTNIDKRSPCPSCGSTKRFFKVNVTTSIAVNLHMSGLQERNGETIGFSESMRQGRISNALLKDDGSVNMKLSGSSPQGEEDTHSACQILKEKLNLDGAKWGCITFGNEPADCVLVDSYDKNITLDVQVIRAIVSQELWRNLNCKGSVHMSLSPTVAVNEIKDAIKAKAKDRRVPRSIRSKLVLALDATRLPGLAFDKIIYRFRSEHIEWVASHGFASVWLVGPTSRLVWRLDA
jgi:hypothetical protein